MQTKEYEVYLKRVKNFFAALPADYFSETRCFDTRIRPSGSDVVPWSDRARTDAVPVAENHVWGKLWDNAWFELQGVIPEAWRDQPVAALLNLGGEVLIFDPDGVPVYNLTNTSVFVAQYRKELYRMSDRAVPGEFSLWAEVAANGLFGDEITPDAPQQRCDVGLIRHLRYGLFREEVWHLRLDIEVLLGLLAANVPTADCVYARAAYPATHYRARQIVRTLNDAVNAYADNPDNATAARAVLRRELSVAASASTMTATAVGHAHIDTGWLWPVRETIRKAARTFAGQLALMERYPDYVFGASQPQHYAFVKAHYPALFEKIKARVKEGRWELQGGMWVEADCNLINGESMVRQFIHGKNFFLDEFGVEVKNLWLPDVFGYAASMPQIIRKANCDHFLTQKISWNQFNKFPYHAFVWRGIDSSEVLSFFPPEDNYNASLTPDQLNYGADNLSENDRIGEFLSLYGVGDGGGGPKEEHVERGLRAASLENCPRVRFGRADNFFARLEAHQETLPRWIGELYLELHRGTLTTQSRTKRNNRRGEQLLTAAEFLLSMFPADYPAEALDRHWKTLLLNQFHDIIPGSSIRGVYEVTEREHAGLLCGVEALCHDAARRHFRADADAMTLLNTLSYPYRRRVELPEAWQNCELLQNGKPIPCDGRSAAVEIPAQGFAVLKRGPALRVEPEIPCENPVLENALVRYEFDNDGRILRAYDKEMQRDLLAPGKAAHELQLYVDKPNCYDAWDIDFFYPESGSTRATASATPQRRHSFIADEAIFQLALPHATLTVRATLESDTKRLDFAVEADWHEKHRLLRVLFPTAVPAREATFDIQYGFVKRPAHRNTSWDQARFESVGQRYCDLSFDGSGIALLNDCKYGYQALDGCIGLSLLRAPEYPDPDADQGRHDFRYSFLPHRGDLAESDVMAQGAMLNRAPLALPGFDAGAAALPCRTLAANGGTLEVLKRAEKSGHTVIRLNETRGRHSTIRLGFAPEFAAFAECDLLERPLAAPVAIRDAEAEIPLAPFEIRTLRLYSRDEVKNG